MTSRPQVGQWIWFLSVEPEPERWIGEIPVDRARVTQVRPPSAEELDTSDAPVPVVNLAAGLPYLVWVDFRGGELCLRPDEVIADVEGSD